MRYASGRHYRQLELCGLRKRPTAVTVNNLSNSVKADNFRIRLTPGILQATLSKLLTYCVLRPTQPSTLSGTGNEQELSYCGLRGKGLVWPIGAMICLLAAP